VFFHLKKQKKLLEIIIFLNCFDMLILKIIFLKIKKHYFHAFYEKYFKKQPLPHFQTLPYTNAVYCYEGYHGVEIQAI
jgi:hypothetical protein